MTGDVQLSRNERYFLRLRYGRRLGDKRLVFLAVQEIKRMQAKEFLDTHGYAPVDKQSAEAEA